MNDTLEPLYIWGNFGDGDVENPSIENAGYQQCPDNPNQNNPSYYIQRNRDYYTGVAKPGWQRYTYPHPLTGSRAPASEPSPAPTATPVPTPTPSPPVDNRPPTVTIISPVDGTVVNTKSPVTISASATDDLGVTKVNFFVNGNLKCTSTMNYACRWNVPAAKGKIYEIQAEAYDAAGNKGSSGIVKVTAR
jgi:hypothetical protein